MFAKRKNEELSYPQNQKMCDPILVTLLKMRSHYSQSSRENATPSSGTSPVGSCKEVPPTGKISLRFTSNHWQRATRKNRQRIVHGDIS